MDTNGNIHDPSLCDETSKPSDSESCVQRACGYWRSGDFGKVFSQVLINNIFEHKIVIIFLLAVLAYSLGAQKNLIEMVLLSTHNICFGKVFSQVLINTIFEHKIVIIFLPISFSICLGCSKEPSQ